MTTKYECEFVIHVFFTPVKKFWVSKELMLLFSKDAINWKMWQ